MEMGAFECKIKKNGLYREWDIDYLRKISAFSEKRELILDPKSQHFYINRCILGPENPRKGVLFH